MLESPQLLLSWLQVEIAAALAAGLGGADLDGAGAAAAPSVAEELLAERAADTSLHTGGAEAGV